MKTLNVLIPMLLAVGVSGCLQQRTADHAGPVTGTPPHPQLMAEAARAREARRQSEMAADMHRRSAQAKHLMAPPHPHPSIAPVLPVETDREQYQHPGDNPIKQVSADPVSTFSIDVDTGSYANVRRMLMAGRLPPQDAVRAEELLNYFNYADPAPEAGGRPFATHFELGPNPWNSKTRLLRIALSATQIDPDALKPANLVFLLDVSGSMSAADKLPLLKRSLRLLSAQLDAEDRVSIVVYAGASGVVLEPTPGDQSAKIDQALEQLQAGGSTHGSAGIQLAYAKARESFIPGGINRVILATDGDFNVGTTNHEALLDLVEQQRESGIALSTLGFGQGNYNDHLMEQLADHGNGSHAYIDNLLEARKVLVEQMGGTLQTVAADVKIQVEFNPAQVSEYRLIGYENRLLRREDFNNDKVDAGEIGAGHKVVALYEVALRGEGGERIDPLRYAAPDALGAQVGELAFVKVRYKQPGASDSQLLSWPLQRDALQADLAQTSDDYRFSAAVAAFAQQLRGGEYLQQFDYAKIIELARGSRGDDPHGYRSDFLRVAGLAQSLQAKKPQGNAVGQSD